MTAPRDLTESELIAALEEATANSTFPERYKAGIATEMAREQAVAERRHLSLVPKT